METASPTGNLLRRTAAVLLLAIPLISLPLAWGRLGGEPIPFFGTAELLSFPLLGLFALAGALAYGDWGAYRRDPRWRFFGTAQMLIVLVTLWLCFRGEVGWRGVGTTLVWLALPVLGAGLRPELERVMPFMAALTAGAMLMSGATSVDFTGLAGNWNWTQALLFALLPGVFLATGDPRWRFWSVIGTAAVFLLIGWWHPAQLSRTAVIAAPLAALLLYLRRRLPVRRPFSVILWGFILLAAGFFALVWFCDFSDSRFQLWKGAADLAAAHGFSGCGMGRFGDLIPAFLPGKYFFTPFAAAWHPHPHSELLVWIAACGLAGGLFLAMLTGLALGRKARSDRELLAQWIFLFLLICGQTDVVCSTVSGGVWLLLAAGVAGGRRKRIAAATPGAWRTVPAAVLALAAILLTINHFCARLDYRRAQLALLKSDFVAARARLRRAVAREDDPETRYDLAELELLRFDAPEAAELSLNRLEKMRFGNFRHAWRLRALAAARRRDYPVALDALDRERGNYPFSVINAGLLAAMLERSGAPAGELAAARERLAILCRLRGIPPSQALTLAPAADDRPLNAKFAPGR